MKISSQQHVGVHGISFVVVLVVPQRTQVAIVEADQCLGMENTLHAFMAHLVLIFEECRRVLKPTGNCWVNMGDSYASTGGGYDENGSRGSTSKAVSPKTQASVVKGKNRVPPEGLKTKDLIGQPWRVAFALQASGWYLRQDNIWHKPNPMPESVRDRATKAHEYVFHLTKSGKYYFDSAVWAEEAVKGAAGSSFNKGKPATHQLGRSSDAKRAETGTRNRRSVWTVATVPYAEAHYATYPPKLITPPLLASTPLNGIVLDPFGGSGTTAQVALAHGRRAVLIERGPQNIILIRKRLNLTLSP